MAEILTVSAFMRQVRTHEDGVAGLLSAVQGAVTAELAVLVKMIGEATDGA